MPKLPDGSYYFDFSPLARAESMMAKVNEHSGGAAADLQREAVRDLLMLSMARSLECIAAHLENMATS